MSKNVITHKKNYITTSINKFKIRKNKLYTIYLSQHKIQTHTHKSTFYSIYILSNHFIIYNIKILVYT